MAPPHWGLLAHSWAALRAESFNSPVIFLAGNSVRAWLGNGSGRTPGAPWGFEHDWGISRAPRTGWRPGAVASGNIRFGFLSCLLATADKVKCQQEAEATACTITLANRLVSASRDSSAAPEGGTTAGLSPGIQHLPSSHGFGKVSCTAASFSNENVFAVVVSMGQGSSVVQVPGSAAVTTLISFLGFKSIHHFCSVGKELLASQLLLCTAPHLLWHPGFDLGIGADSPHCHAAHLTFRMCHWWGCG
ncbi:hypothetical protein Nmel_016115 [Mimus melanotis]